MCPLMKAQISNRKVNTMLFDKRCKKPGHLKKLHMSLSYDFQRRSWESDWRSWGVDWSISEINMCMVRSLKYSNACARCYLDNLLYIQHFFTISYHPGCPSALIGCRWWIGIVSPLLFFSLLISLLKIRHLRYFSHPPGYIVLPASYFSSMTS